MPAMPAETIPTAHDGDALSTASGPRQQSPHPPVTADQPVHNTDLVDKLELTFRLLGKRVYTPALRRLRATHRGVDKGSLPLLSALEELDNARPSDLAAALELDLSTVSRHISHFEQLGLLTRTPDAADRRACRVSLTTEGRDSLTSVRVARSAMLTEVFTSWSEPEREQLLALLGRLATDIARLPSSTAPLPATPFAPPSELK